MRKTLRKAAAIATAGLLMSGLAACGSGDDDASKGGLTKVKVGVLPAVDLAPVYLGIKNGYFKDEGIEVVPQILDSGPAIVAAVIAGDAQIGFSNPVSLLVGRSQGLPLTLVAPAGADGDSEETALASIFVKGDSKITGLKDLIGKTLAVNALDNILGVTLKNALEKEGLDPEGVKLVEVPFPEMAAAVETGKVDAGFGVEPFVTLAVDGGAKRVAYPYLVTSPALPSAYFFSTDQYVDGDSKAVKAFQAGLAKSVKYASENEDAKRAIVGEYTKISPEVITKMRFPTFPDDIDPDKLQLFINLTDRYKLLKKDVSSDEMLRGWKLR